MNEDVYGDQERGVNPESGAAAIEAIGDPLRRPQPWDPDWWRCLRRGPVSGRYEGQMTAPQPGRYALDLRVDIDPRYRNSPVMERLSGDVYQIFTFSWPGRPPIRWRVYRYSWIVDRPNVDWARCHVSISGGVRFWEGTHPATKIHVNIPWGTFQPAGPAAVTFTEASGATASYDCPRTSDCFREMMLETDVCQSVNAEPVLPTYDTHAHDTHPPDLPQRTLTIEEAYREAGICVSINPTRTIIDDSAAEFNSWSPAELHDAMETHFSMHPGGWPKWQMWGLMAGRFDSAGVGGIMFDAAAAYGGAGDAPDRQGFAVFRDHSWFTDLAPGTPSNQDQAWAMRHFLYTWVHEAGHAFNFLHSWDKGRPDSLSWMNYDWRYDNRNGAGTYWADFEFRFDDEELIHLRHGNRASVIMGGDPWASGGHMEVAPGVVSSPEGDMPIEFLLRSQGYFDFMESIEVEFRLRNRLEDIPLDVDTRLNPEFGGVAVYIRKPSGVTQLYSPLLCKLGTPEIQTLKPAGNGIRGEDRFSQRVFLSYGSKGFYFDEPGEYLVKAVYQGAGDVFFPSNTIRFRVGKPMTRDEDRFAQDFFSHSVGMSLYFGGSRSPFLTKGMDLIETMSDQFKGSIAGLKASALLADTFSRAFYRVQDGVITKTASPEPEKTLSLTTPALKMIKRKKDKAFNLIYHDLVRKRVECMKVLDQKQEAKAEVGALIKDLTKRGVNEPVLNAIKAYQKRI